MADGVCWRSECWRGCYYPDVCSWTAPEHAGGDEGGFLRACTSCGGATDGPRLPGCLAPLAEHPGRLVTTDKPDGVPSLDDQMRLAVRAMAHHAGQASRIDRTGWTEQQWIEDADRLMNDPDGSVSSLLNGHVTALLAFYSRASTAQDEAGEVERLRAQVAAVEALADLWERDQIAYTPRGTANALRAALDQATGGEG